MKFEKLTNNFHNFLFQYQDIGQLHYLLYINDHLLHLYLHLLLFSFLYFLRFYLYIIYFYFLLFFLCHYMHYKKFVLVQSVHVSVLLFQSHHIQNILFQYQDLLIQYIYILYIYSSFHAFSYQILSFLSIPEYFKCILHLLKFLLVTSFN